MKSYKIAFKLKSEIPTRLLYVLSRVIGSKKMKKEVAELKDYVEQCRQIGLQFAYFMNNEWIFDNASAFMLMNKIKEQEPNLQLDFDVRKIKWFLFIQNHAYGIKKYCLNEEAYLPSLGFTDARNKMASPAKQRIVNPFGKGIF